MCLESLGVKRPWLTYIEEENKMHCVTGREAAEVDKYIKQKMCIQLGLTNLKVTVEYHELPKNHQKAMKIVGINQMNYQPMK